LWGVLHTSWPADDIMFRYGFTIQNSRDEYGLHILI
jgi:hypothetical protein